MQGGGGGNGEGCVRKGKAGGRSLGGESFPWLFPGPGRRGLQGSPPQLLPGITWGAFVAAEDLMCWSVGPPLAEHPPPPPPLCYGNLVLVRKLLLAPLPLTTMGFGLFSASFPHLYIEVTDNEALPSAALAQDLRQVHACGGGSPTSLNAGSISKN